jgi:energy-coupling factor transport system ATP-binding protein
MQLSRGEIGIVTGGNDSGKSSILNAISGIAKSMLNAKTEGTCQVDGTISTVLQDSDLFLMPTVEEELEFPLIQYGESRSIRNIKVNQINEKLNLSNLSKRLMHTLSGGERQRVALAASMVTNSDLLLLDEPLAQLDPRGATLVTDLIRELADHGKTVLIASTSTGPYHQIADRFFWIDSGKMHWSGSPSSFLKVNEEARSMGIDVDGYGLFNRHQEEDYIYKNCMPTGRTVALDMSKVTYCYDKNFSLENIDLQIKKGGITAISGENGSGKSTLLKLAAAILKPQSGSISVLGRNIKGLDIAEATKKTGFLFQNPDHQIFQTQVDQELAWGLIKRGFSRSKAEEKTRYWLEKLSMKKLSKTHPYSLSKTCRQWIALAGVLVRTPPLLLLDEPTFGMDTNASRRFADIIMQVAKEGTTVLIITHNHALAAHCADRLIAMEKGFISN